MKKEGKKKGRIVLSQKKYRKLCDKVFERDGYKCQGVEKYGFDCATPYEYIQPHHIIFRSKGGDDSYENLITMCWICHEEIHGNKVKPPKNDFFM